MNVDIFVEFLPSVVLLAGAVLFAVSTALMRNKLNIEPVVKSIVPLVLFFLAMIGSVAAKEYRSMYFTEKAVCYSNDFYTETENLIQNGYIVYINGVIIDSDKIFVSDYSVDKIHINNELREIYISTD